MKLRKLPFILGILLMISVFGTLNVHAATRSYLSKEYDTPNGNAMLTDYREYERKVHDLSVPEERTALNPSGAAKVRKWQSDFDFVVEAPTLLIYFDGQMPINTEFEIKLTNLQWFFRNSDDDASLPVCTDNYTGGIETLFPTSYNKHAGRYVPDDSSGVNGVYTRELENEIAYNLIISDDNEYVARIVLFNGAYSNQPLRIPLVTRLTKYADAKVEIVPTVSSSVSAGVHTVFRADKSANSNRPIISTTTNVPNPMNGISEISIPEIVITENIHGVIGNGAVILTAPDGFALLPDVDSSRLKKIDIHTMNIKDDDGEPVVNVSLDGGLKWKNMRQVFYQQDPDRTSDIKLYHRNPAGNIDTSKFIVEFNNLVKSADNNTGSVTITGLKLVALHDEHIEGDLYINISPYMGMEELIIENFKAGVLDSGASGSDYMNSFNINNMSLADLIKTPEFKSKVYITHTGGNLQPEAIITRGQLCDMVYTLLADTGKNYTHSFSDVEGNVYENAIAFCAENAYINGYGDGTFLPNGYIKRGEFAVILNNILKLDASVNVEFADKDHFAYEAITQLVHAQIMQGYGNNDLGQENLINKQEAVAMINRAFERGNKFTPNGLIYDDMSLTLWSYGDMMNAACGHIVTK